MKKQQRPLPKFQPGQIVLYQPFGPRHDAAAVLVKGYHPFNPLRREYMVDVKFLSDVLSYKGDVITPARTECTTFECLFKAQNEGT